MAGIEAGLTQLDAARRIRDLERALPDMNAKLTTASNNAEEARSQAADTTRKMRSLQDSAEQFRDQLDRLQRQLIQQHAKQEDTQIAAPAANTSDGAGKRE
jgi:chromosome segregation ATPase